MSQEQPPLKITPNRESRRTEPAISPADIAYLTLWFGLFTGLAEAAVHLYRKLYIGRIILLSRDVYWMAPLGNLLLVAIPGVVLYLGAKRFPRYTPYGLVVFLLALPGFFSLSLLFGYLSKLAAVLLSLGLGVQIARIALRWRPAFSRFVRSSVVAFLVVEAVLLIAIPAARFLTENRATAALPTPNAGSPNVLLIVLDTVRAESLSLLGYDRLTTPVLDNLAQESVVFSRAYSTSPYTLPSHATMFTGRYPDELSVSWEIPLDDTHPTLAEQLAGDGYLTAGFVGNIGYGSYEFGLNRGFHHYEDWPVSFSQVLISSSLWRTVLTSDVLRNSVDFHHVLSHRTAENINQAFLRWLDGQDGRPFFAFLNYFDAHEPYLSPAQFQTRFGEGRPSGIPFFHMQHLATRRNKPSMGPADAQDEQDQYDGAIAYLDHQIGILINELQGRGQLENTLLVIVSDHGEHFGEHGLYGHGNSLYRQLIHVPLLIRYPPSAPGGTVVNEVASLRDLPATILGLVGSDDPSALPGQSLEALWSTGAQTSLAYSEVDGRGGQPDWYPIAKGDLSAVVEGQLELIRNGDGTEELYDMALDDRQEVNLVNLPEYQEEVRRLRQAIQTHSASLQHKNDRVQR